MTYPIRRYPERQFRQIIINLRIPTHKARYKKINKLKHHSTGDLSIHVCNLRCVKSRVLDFLTHFVMVKWTKGPSHCATRNTLCPLPDRSKLSP